MLNYPTWVVNFYDLLNGNGFIAISRINDKFYKIVNDGVEDDFFAKDEPELIGKSTEELAEYCMKNNYNSHGRIVSSSAYDILKDDEFIEFSKMLKISGL